MAFESMLKDCRDQPLSAAEILARHDEKFEEIEVGALLIVPWMQHFVLLLWTPPINDRSSFMVIG